MNRMQRMRRVDFQVSVLTAAIVIISCSVVYLLSYALTHADMIKSLQDRVMSIHTALEPHLQVETFQELKTIEDEQKQIYLDAKSLLESAKHTTGVRYLYTATRTAEGNYIYQVDGLPSDSPDFRHAGDPIEPEIIPELENALSGAEVLPNEIKNTSWGHIFIAYLPVHVEDSVVGVLGIEFDAAHQYKTYRIFRIVTPLVIVLACLAGGLVAMMLFRRISNPTFKDLSTMDFLTGLRGRNAFELAAQNLNKSHALAQTALLAVDLDGLKKVNDTLGHLAGDQYIRACGNALQAVVKKPGVVYRIGGDEFVVLIPMNDQKEMEILLQSLEREVEANNRDAEIKLLYSAGYAFYDPDLDGNLYATLDRADAMMYENKRLRAQARQQEKAFRETAD